jgi:hypothetical protein
MPALLGDRDLRRLPGIADHHPVPRWSRVATEWCQGRDLLWWVRRVPFQPEAQENAGPSAMVVRLGATSVLGDDPREREHSMAV